MHRLTKLALVVALVAAPFAANARSGYLTTFNSKYGTANTALDSCSTCHGSGGTSTWNSYGNDVMAKIGSGISAALTAVEPLRDREPADVGVERGRGGRGRGRDALRVARQRERLDLARREGERRRRGEARDLVGGVGPLAHRRARRAQPA